MSSELLSKRSFKIVIIGAGLSGVGFACHLLRSGACKAEEMILLEGNLII